MGRRSASSRECGSHSRAKDNGDMPPAGWVLYDDACGFCRRWVPYWAETLSKRGFSIAPLQSAWVQERLNAPADELLDDLRLLLPDGRRCAARTCTAMS